MKKSFMSNLEASSAEKRFGEPALPRLKIFGMGVESDKSCKEFEEG
jgi:hypothetical protein